MVPKKSLGENEGLLDGLLCGGRGGEGKNASHQTILSAKLLTSKSIQNMFMTNTCLLKSLFVTFLKYLL